MRLETLVISVIAISVQFAPIWAQSPPNNATAPAPIVPPVSQWTIMAANHWIFQMANLFLLISYALTRILFLRIVLAAGSFCYALWGLIILHVALDTVLWNILFLLINLGHIAKILYDLRPLHFDADREFVYENIFFRYASMERHAFAKLTASCSSVSFADGEFLAKKGDLVANLSVLISGRIGVYIVKGSGKTKSFDPDNMLLINELSAPDFVDSPEWMFGHEKYSVWLRCQGPVRVYRWPFFAVKKLEKSDPALRAAMTGVMARDIAAKLVAVQEELRQRDEASELFKSQSKKFGLLKNPRLVRAGIEDNMFGNQARSAERRSEESTRSSGASSRSSVEEPPKDDKGDYWVEIEQKATVQ